MPRAIPSLLVEPAISAVEALRIAVVGEHDLERLTGFFAATIAEHGISGHFCAGRDDGGQLSPLFGDSPWLFAEDRFEDDLAEAHGPCALAIRGALGDNFLVALAPPARRLDDRTAARVRGFASLYVARGAVLHEKRADPTTSCGLSLCERVVLGRLLAGDSVLDIALRLDRSPAAIESHIADAMATLGTTDRADAIAFAARRGWLLTMVNDFSALSPRNNGYYS